MMENGRTPTNGVLGTRNSGEQRSTLNRQQSQHDNHNSQGLQHELSGLQIYFIVLSLVIGSGVFNNNGEVLRLAGPMGLLGAVLFFGSVAVCVGETVAELVQLFPVRNAIFEYVEKFVDGDVAWAVGVLYWFTYASIFPFQILNAADQLKFWLPEQGGTRIFAALIPFLLLAINLVRVKWFGRIETISGAIKLALVLVISILLYIVAAKGDITKSHIGQGLRYDGNYTLSKGHAFCYGLPLVAFSYLGIEAFTMAAFEATDMKSITTYSQLTHWTVIVVYFMCTMGIILTVDWQDIALPLTYTMASNNPTLDCKTRSAVVIGVSKGKKAFGSTWGDVTAAGGGGKIPGGPCVQDSTPPTVAAAVNGILLFTTLSAANASLYVASRTLYGLTYKYNKEGTLGLLLKGTTGDVWGRTRVPAMALFLSFIIWYAIIYLDIVKDDGSEEAADFMHILGVSQSVSCLIVWAALCFAYIRFHRGTHKLKNKLSRNADLRPFLRASGNYRPKTVLGWLQPLAAGYAFLVCLLIFVFISASMWKTGVNGTKFMAAYLPHILFILVVVGRKSYRYARGKEWRWVKLDGDLITNLRSLAQNSAHAASDGLRRENGSDPAEQAGRPPFHVDEQQQQRQQQQSGRPYLNDDYGHRYQPQGSSDGFNLNINFGGGDPEAIPMEPLQPNGDGGPVRRRD
ncbi:hypothetical protein RB601_003685 [Gaeumannomyces tritici]